MTPEQWTAAKLWFGRALEMPARARGRFLEEECPADLRGEIRELLEADSAAGGFLEAPVHDFQGRWFGPYRAIRELGRGGMGVVYLAERTDAEFQKLVAIKLVPSALMNPDLVSRFHQERQILASLEHPHIARLLDGGTTPDGYPYLVMEYVEGEPLDEYCRQRRPSLASRLELFRKICDAVHFAHRSLVVHRDLKPANLLITPDGEPKLLDFGIAKIVSQEAAPRTTLAKAWTADYASPEQLLSKRVTTSTDVYSLGLLLYELLTDKRAQPCSGKALDEVIRIVCEEVPPKPSLADGKNLSGDLDAITMRAIEKEPERRYGSAEELSAEVGRFLSGRPVLAREPTFGYLVRRFVGRHRLGVAGAACALVLSLAAVGAIVWQARIARQERAEAQQRFDEARKLARSMIYELHDEVATLPGSLEARRVLVSQALEYLERLSRHAAGEIPLQLELASAYRRLGEVQGDPDQFNLGDSAGAIRSFGQAQRILEPLRGRPEAARELLNVYLAQSNIQSGGRADPAALNSARNAVEFAKQIVQRNPNGHEERYLLARAYLALAFMGTSEGVQHAQSARQMLERLVEEHPGDSRMRRTLGIVEHRVGSYYVTVPQDYRSAVPRLRRALDLFEAAARDDPADGRTQMQISMQCYLLAICLTNLGDLPGAETYAERAVEIRERLHVADPHDARVRDGFAAARRLLGDVQIDWKPASARRHYESALTLVAGFDPPNLTRVQATRAHSYLGIGRLEAKRGNEKAACVAFAQASNAFRKMAENRMSPHERKEAQSAAAASAACPSDGKAALAAGEKAEPLR